MSGNAENSPQEPGRAAPASPVAFRREPAEREWPGRPVTEADVLRQPQSPGDWFTSQERGDANRQTVAVHRAHRQSWVSSTTAMRSYQWFIAGDKRANAAALAAATVLPSYLKGCPVFHDGGFNFGRVLNDGLKYELAAALPSCSVVILRADTLQHDGEALLLYSALRRRGCRLILVGDEPGDLPVAVMQSTELIRRPMTLDGPDAPVPTRLVMPFLEWSDYPLQSASELGPPDAIGKFHGEPARQAHLLTAVIGHGKDLRGRSLLVDTFQGGESGRRPSPLL